MARAAATLEAKDPDVRSAPAVSRLVDCPDAAALLPAMVAAESALGLVAPGRGVADAGAEARARAAVDARACAQAAACAAGFSTFTDSLAAAADAPRRAGLAAKAAALLAEAEAQGEAGDVDAAQRLTAEAEATRRQADGPMPKLPGSDPLSVRPAD